MVTVDLVSNLQPDLSGNPFLRGLKFNLTEIICKKDWERKADKAAQIIIQYWRNDAQRGNWF